MYYPIHSTWYCIYFLCMVIFSDIRIGEDLSKLKFIPAMMRFIGKPGRFTVGMPVIFYISAFIDPAADDAPGKRI
jgi:hypothetical protein